MSISAREQRKLTIQRPPPDPPNADPAVATVAAPTTNWRDLLTCGVCSELFDDPKLLPCLHTFCRCCLEDSLQANSIRPGQEFLCPVCHDRITVPRHGVSGFKANILFITIQDFLDSKILAEDQLCDGCGTESNQPAKVTRKCVECNDWLCAECSNMHTRFKMTRHHHLLSARDLRTEQYDDLLKTSIEPLLCGIHAQPLELYCTNGACRAPICEQCARATHATHTTCLLREQANRESREMSSRLADLRAGMAVVRARIENARRDEKQTSSSRKHTHRAIDQRLEEVVESFVREIGDYAERLHTDVEEMARRHQTALGETLEEERYHVQAMEAVDILTTSLLEFGRDEETVAMAKDIHTPLDKYSITPNSSLPAWKQPRLNPAGESHPSDISRLFGALTFAGEVTQSVFVRTFSAKLAQDQRAPALCDLVTSEDGRIMAVDRDNRCVKIFDEEGQVLSILGRQTLRSPNRICFIGNNTDNLLIKDEKLLKVLDGQGNYVSSFGETLQQPVGLASSFGNVYVTDWVSVSVNVFDSKGSRSGHFPVGGEAPGYIALSDDGQKIAVSDWKLNQVKVFNTQGTALVNYGTHGAGDCQLDHPYGVCFDRHDHLVVADTWNNRVHLISATDGAFVRYLLTAADGLQWPQAVAIDRSGDLVVAEQHGLIKVFKYLA